MSQDLGSCNSLEVKRYKTNADDLANPETISRYEWLYNHESILVGHLIYVFGGHDVSGHHRRRVLVLDTLTWRWGNWKSAFNMTIGEFTMVLIDSSLYFFGGYSAAYEHQGLKVFLLDLALQELRTTDSSGEALIPRGKSAGHYVENLGLIIVFGGVDYHKSSNSLVGYNLSSKTWKPLFARGRPPIPRPALASCMHGCSDIVYYGGMDYSTENIQSDFFILHCVNHHFTWSRPLRRRLPQRKYRSAMGCVGHRIFIFAGYFLGRGLAKSDDVYVCDLETLGYSSSNSRSSPVTSGDLQLTLRGQHLLPSDSFAYVSHNKPADHHPRRC